MKSVNMLIYDAYEFSFWRSGYQNVTGVDEVGRGPLAGPVVAAACLVKKNFFNLVMQDPQLYSWAFQVNDSKALSARLRLKIYDSLVNCPYLVCAHACVNASYFIKR